MSGSKGIPKMLESLLNDTAADGTKFYWSAERNRNTVLLQSQLDFSVPQIRAPQTLLKRARQRFIYRTNTKPNDVVIKLFPLKAITSKLRHPKYAFAEFNNMIRAQRLGIPIPEPLCFIEKRKIGLVCCSGVGQTFLNGYTDLRTLYNARQLTYFQVADYATDVLIDMFDIGANHIDLRDENIMLDQNTGMLKIIDWQYANFTIPRSAWLLEYLTAYFIRLAPEKHRAMLASDWLFSVSERANLRGYQSDAFIKRTRALLNKRASVKQRLSLKKVTS